jgi:elongation factor Ts
MAKAAKRGDRETKEGRIVSYIHANGKIGVLLELNCETDFVANNEGFEELGKEICLQIAAANPSYLAKEDVPAEVIDSETKVLRSQLLGQGKKEEQLDKIIPGKLTSFYSEVCLLEQQHIKDNKKLVRELIQEYIAKFGENITIGKFARYQIGG